MKIKHTPRSPGKFNIVDLDPFEQAAALSLGFLIPRDITILTAHDAHRDFRQIKDVAAEFSRQARISKYR